MAWPASAVEVYHSRQRSGRDRSHFVGVRKWECAKDDEDDAEDYRWANRSWAVNDHVMRMTGLDVDPRARVGKALLVGHYETLYNPATHPVGRATIAMVVGGDKTRVLKDVFGNPIWSQPGTDGKFVRPIDGDNFKWDSITIIKLRTAYPYAKLRWSTILAAQNTYNKDALPNLGGAAAGTLLLMGAKIPNYYLLDNDSSIVPIEYFLAYKVSKWSAPIWCQKFRRIVSVEPAVATIDEDGDPELYWSAAGDHSETVDNVADAYHHAVTRDKDYDNPVPRWVYKDDTTEFEHLAGLLAW